MDTWLADSDVAILYGRGDYPGFKVDKLMSLTDHADLQPAPGDGSAAPADAARRT